jgi:hypothetical protein
MRHGHPDQAELDEQLDKHAVFPTRSWTGDRKVPSQGTCTRGLLLGLGFDTVTEAGLQVVAGGAAARSPLWWAILTLLILVGLACHCRIPSTPRSWTSPLAGRSPSRSAGLLQRHHHGTVRARRPPDRRHRAHLDPHREARDLPRAPCRDRIGQPQQRRATGSRPVRGHVGSCVGLWRFDQIEHRWEPYLSE